MIIIRVIYDPSEVDSHRTTVSRVVQKKDLVGGFNLTIRKAAEDALQEMEKLAPWEKKKP